MKILVKNSCNVFDCLTSYRNNIDLGIRIDSLSSNFEGTFFEGLELRKINLLGNLENNLSH